jgi:hypothetical protein
MIFIADSIGELWIARVIALLSQLTYYLGQRDFRVPE